MKTAMQEAIKEIAKLWSSPSDIPTYTQIFKVLESKLEKEKEQIIEAGNSCALKQHLHNDRINKMTESELRQFAEEEHLTFGEEHYNETFKK